MDLNQGSAPLQGRTRFLELQRGREGHGNQP